MELNDLKHLLMQKLSDVENINCESSKRKLVQEYKNEFINDMLISKPYLPECENYFQNFIIDGCNIDPSKINPQIEICNSRKQFDIYDYFRLWSSFPTRDRPGRRFKFILYDTGQTKKAIMAIGCISSCIRQCEVRDKWIGWCGPQYLELRKKKLAYIMDISTCVGIPPYSFLTSGKLLCYLLLSKEFRKAYFERYKNQKTKKIKRIVTDIAIYVTSGIYGKNTPQYKGIKVNGINRFQYVGNTKGYSTFHIPQYIYKYILNEVNIPDIKRKGSIDGGASVKLRILREIARVMDIDDDKIVYSGHKRSVFLATLALNWQNFLLDRENDIFYFDDQFFELFLQWKKRWLDRRISSYEVIKSVQEFEAKRFSVFNV